ncbi:bcl-2-interacting killer [Notolabrus celidotus]|uniref:bcl-2-interacting killer n=1 Tax=Notolabrus celidotus TaxID=1203425 RepID=UPI00148FFB53|nr:bcl-2-interacting killer [Notolabrus celidotus]
MVEQTRQLSRVVTLQAGPGEAGTSSAFDVNFRINDRAARVVGHQLAVIGDQLVREQASRHPNWPLAPLHLLRPAQALTRTIYRDIHSQILGFQSLSAAVKAWIESSVPGQGMLRADAWVSSLKPVTCTGWTRGALVAVAVVAAVTTLGALWVEWKGP